MIASGHKTQSVENNITSKRHSTTTLTNFHPVFTPTTLKWTPSTLGGQAFLALLFYVIVESPRRQGNLVDLLDFPALNNKVVVFQLFR
jgi:hypothetical protein